MSKRRLLSLFEAERWIVPFTLALDLYKCRLTVRCYSKTKTEINTSLILMATLGKTILSILASSILAALTIVFVSPKKVFKNKTVVQKTSTSKAKEEKDDLFI